MATLEFVDELPSIERAGKASVSGPLVEDFMASPANVAKVTDTKGKAQSTKAILQKYITSRDVDASVFVRKGIVYLQKGRKTDENGDQTASE